MIHRTAVACSFALLAAACGRGPVQYKQSEVGVVKAISASAFQQDCVLTTMEMSGLETVRVNVSQNEGRYTYFGYDNQDRSISLTEGSSVPEGQWNKPANVTNGFVMAANQCAKTPTPNAKASNTNEFTADYIVRSVVSGTSYTAQYNY